jgi:hypothetical protein
MQGDLDKHPIAGREFSFVGFAGSSRSVRDAHRLSTYGRVVVVVDVTVGPPEPYGSLVSSMPSGRTP